MSVEAISAPAEAEARILTITGGGVRGLIPLMILIEIQRRLDKRNEFQGGPKTKLNKHIHAFAGVSIGYLVSLMLAVDGAGKMAKDFDVDEGGKSFKDNAIKIFEANPIWRFAVGLNLHNEIFNSRVFEEILSSQFGLASLSDIHQVDCFGLGYAPEVKQAQIYSSYHARYSEIERMVKEERKRLEKHNLSIHDSIYHEHVFSEKRISPFSDDKRYTNGDMYLAKAIRASCSLPMAFSHAYTSNTGFGSGISIDGGFFNPNISRLVLWQCEKLYPKAKRFKLISIGTGEDKPEGNIDGKRLRGPFDWMPRLLDCSMTSSAQEAHETLAGLKNFNGKELDYKHLNFSTAKLPPGFDKPDMHPSSGSPLNMEKLEALGQWVIECNSEQIDRIVEELAPPRASWEALGVPRYQFPEEKPEVLEKKRSNKVQLASLRP